MDVNSKQVDPSTAHMLSLFSTRLGSVTPGEHLIPLFAPLSLQDQAELVNLAAEARAHH